MASRKNKMYDKQSDNRYNNNNNNNNNGNKRTTVVMGHLSVDHDVGTKINGVVPDEHPSDYLIEVKVKYYSLLATVEKALNRLSK
uniref:Uncharacterized protein n=1 Tax=Glossina palpalis gambiensis TaxID=67801 RepID=A0A1B0AR87_9MUSC